MLFFTPYFLTNTLMKDTTCSLDILSVEGVSPRNIFSTSCFFQSVERVLSVLSHTQPYLCNSVSFTQVPLQILIRRCTPVCICYQLIARTSHGRRDIAMVYAVINIVANTRKKFTFIATVGRLYDHLTCVAW